MTAAVNDDVPEVAAEHGFPLDPQDANLLTQIGFLAAYQGDVQSADAIFDGLAGVRPGKAYPWIGKALARFHMGLASEAALLLEPQQKFMTDADEAELLQVWRGMALQISGHASRAQSLLAPVAAGSGPGSAMAQSLLGLSKGDQ